MTQVTRLAIRLTLAALLVGAVAASAGTKPAPQPIAIGSGAQILPASVSPIRTNATCTLGVTDPAAYIIDYIYPPNDGYYTLLDPASCTTCGNGTVTATAAHVYLNFRAACSQNVVVNIVGATGDASCYTPDPSNVLCPAFTATLAPAAAGNYNYSIAIPGGCCISGPCFLGITFPSFGSACATSTTWPRLITTAACDNACYSWNLYSSYADDLCYDVGFPGYPVMNLDVDCCASTKAHTKSWGSMKSMYR